MRLKKNIFILIVLSSVFSTIDAEIKLDSIESVTDWNIIQKNEIEIRWTTYDSYPICQTTSILPFSIESISSIIEDVSNYPKVFKRIHKTNILEKDIIHVMLDMPFLLSDRDYVIKYKKYKTPDNWEFTFSPVKHINAPLNKKYVRLVNAAGKWKLISKGDNQTSVSYTWNGELLGDFPNFALERAWKTQGNEIIHWINDALE
jgi:ribosome-associated toxin RatA of RatAB toxin-antitoxin module